MHSPCDFTGELEQPPRTVYHSIYIFKKNNKSTLIDAAEIDVVVLGLPTNQQDYSYSVTLGGTFDAGDKVIISMLRPDLSNWTLRQGLSSTSAIRTSLIYWKL